MFDWYKPVIETCPCGTKLEWQGKDGPRELYVWQQWCPYPVEHRLGDDPYPPEVLKELRLPAAFTIYGYGCEKHHARGVCRCVDGVWVETIFFW